MLESRMQIVRAAAQNYTGPQPQAERRGVLVGNLPEGLAGTTAIAPQAVSSTPLDNTGRAQHGR